MIPGRARLAALGQTAVTAGGAGLLHGLGVADPAATVAVAAGLATMISVACTAFAAR